MNLTPFDAYRIYLGLKRFFSTAKVLRFSPVKNVKYSTFTRRNDFRMFITLCKKYTTDEEIIGLYVSNLLVYTDCWIGDLLTPECEQTYMKWKGRNESLDYHFGLDCDSIVRYINENELTFEDLFAPNSGIPHISKMLIAKLITPETYAILDILLQFGDRLSVHYKDNIVWETLTLRYTKYRAFMNITDEQKKKYKQTLLSKLTAYNIYA